MTAVFSPSIEAKEDGEGPEKGLFGPKTAEIMQNIYKIAENLEKVLHFG